MFQDITVNELEQKTVELETFFKNYFVILKEFITKICAILLHIKKQKLPMWIVKTHFPKELMSVVGNYLNLENNLIEPKSALPRSTTK